MVIHLRLQSIYKKEEAMDLNNITEGIAGLGDINPAEEIGSKIEEATNGATDVVGQIQEQAEGMIGDIFGSF